MNPPVPPLRVRLSAEHARRIQQEISLDRPGLLATLRLVRKWGPLSCVLRQMAVLADRDVTIWLPRHDARSVATVRTAVATFYTAPAALRPSQWAELDQQEVLRRRRARALGRCPRAWADRSPCQNRLMQRIRQSRPAGFLRQLRASIKRALYHLVAVAVHATLLFVHHQLASENGTPIQSDMSSHDIRYGLGLLGATPLLPSVLYRISSVTYGILLLTIRPIQGRTFQRRIQVTWRGASSASDVVRLAAAWRLGAHPPEDRLLAILQY